MSNRYKRIATIGGDDFIIVCNAKPVLDEENKVKWIDEGVAHCTKQPNHVNVFVQLKNNEGYDNGTFIEITFTTKQIEELAAVLKCIAAEPADALPYDELPF